MLTFLGKMRRPAAVPKTKSHHVPRGMRVYAIGDIHGRDDLLDALLGKIDADIDAHPGCRPVLVFLGDYIDRGAQSAQVLDRLRAIKQGPREAYFVLGNHEEALLRLLGGDHALFDDWLRYGGRACLESYGADPDAAALLDGPAVTEWLVEQIPPTHRAFLEECDDSISIGDYLFVHAGIRPGTPLSGQLQRDLRWIRAPFLYSEADHGVTVVHGHSISREVEWRSNRIGVDTGAYRTGVLSAVVLAGSRRRAIQAVNDDR